MRSKSRAATGLGVAAAVTAAATAGSLATNSDSRWFAGLRKPSWQPSNRVFPFVWTALFAGLAVTSTAAITRLSRHRDPRHVARYERTLATNLVLNTGWSLLFWRAKELPLATADAAALTANTLVLARRAARAHPLLGLSLLPYAAWSAFATGLSSTLTALNPRKR